MTSLKEMFGYDPKDRLKREGRDKAQLTFDCEFSIDGKFTMPEAQALNEFLNEHFLTRSLEESNWKYPAFLKLTEPKKTFDFDDFIKGLERVFPYPVDITVSLMGDPHITIRGRGDPKERVFTFKGLPAWVFHVDKMTFYAKTEVSRETLYGLLQDEPDSGLFL